MSGENERRRRNDDSELPGISSVTRTSTGTSSSINMTDGSTTSPLLVLLDGALSRDEARVAEAMHIILHEYKVVVNATTCNHRNSSAIQPNCVNEKATEIGRAHV